MSKKNKNQLNETLAISRADLREVPSTTENTANLSPSSIMLTSGAFDTLPGEIFSGLNILKLVQGEAAGPFRMTRTGKQLMPAKGKKPAEEVTFYAGEHLAFSGREVRMPIAASFIGKCEEAKLTTGDIFAVRRSGDYIDKKFKQTCQGFDLRVMARAGSKEASEFIESYAPKSA